MSTLFHKPNTPAPAAPPANPAPPSVDTAIQDQQNNDAALLRKRRGRAAMMLSDSPQGFGAPAASAKTLLGQ